MEPVFEKEQQLVQGPGILKVRARLCRVTVLHIFSQETGVLLFYVKPLVRNLLFFMCLTIKMLFIATCIML